MSMQALNAQQRPSLLARYQPKGGSQDPLGTPAAPVGDNPVHPITKSTSQRSLQNSSLLQRYQPKPLGAAATTGRTPSQRSLDQSRLLRRYYQPHSLDDGQSPASPSTPADSTQLLQQPTQPQRYSSQKSLEGSKLLQRYSNTVNNSQEFTGLSGRESTPVAGFARAASLEPERSVQRSSLLSKYTPRFGKSLDRNQVPPPAAAAAAGYGSQQHLPQRTVPERAAQSLASSRAEIADYGADHFDQYRDSAVRSRSSSVSRGGPTPKKGGSLPRGSLRKLPAVDAEWATPVTPETLPMVGAVEEPVVGSIASAMPLPMVSVIPPTPAIGTEVGSAARMLPTTGLTPTVAPVAAPVAVPPIKPVRKDLPAQHIRVATYRASEEVPLAREESFGTIPTSATPSRERLRSQLDAKGLRDDNDDGADRVSRGAESLIGGIIDAAPGARGAYPYEVSENNGYAIVRKEAPPRPPAPMRRRKSTRSLDAPPSAPVRQFHTLPSYSVSPVRPQRNYSTISPNRPPRRKSVSSLTGSQQQLGKSTLGEVAPYEDVLDAGPTQAPAPPRPPPPATKLKSGDVVNRMKDRPLPAPPRPTRKTRRPDGTFDHHQDLDGGAERMVSAGEVETATQTDPLSDDFGLDAEIAAVTAAASRATDTEVLEGALSRFRDGNARALSDRPKSSRSGSRPETPASILIERKVSTPSLTHESVVEASLTVQPLDGEFDDDQYIAELVKKYVSDEARKPEPRKTERSDRFRKSTSSLGRSEDPIDPVAVGGSSALRPASLRSTSRSSVDGRLLAITPEPLRNVEISPTVIEEIVERLRTTEQLHIDELHRLHQQQLEDLRRQHEDQKRQQEQRLEQQQRQLLDQQSQQLNETQKLKEQIVQQQNQQQLLLTQQQNQQQLLLVAQQQQQLLMEQQDKERELQREKERELLRERELELERARERERELHLAREAELQRAREVEQQRLRDLELQRAIEAEKVRQDRGLRELELQRAIEAEQARHREAAQAQAAHEAAVAREQAGAAAHESQVAKETAPTASEPPTEGATVDVVDGATVPVVTPQEQPPVPVRPPLPLPPFAYHPDYLAYGVSPSAAAAAAAAASSYLMRANAPPSEEDGMAPLAPQRRRRHHRSRRESTSEEDQQLHRERERRQHRHATRSPEPSIQSLGGQLMRACGTSLRQTGDDLMSMLRASSKDENKRDLHIAIIVLIVIVAGLMALGMSGEKAVHHHHWDYFSPPGHGSSA